MSQNAHLPPYEPHTTRQWLVEELCAGDVLADRTRSLLLKLEKQGDRLGWGHRDNIDNVFYVERNLDSGSLYHRPAPWLSKSVDIALRRNGGHVGNAYLELAVIFENAASGQIDNKLPPAFRSPNMRRNSGPGGDLWPPHHPGWKFYGYGVRTEMWGITSKADPNYEQIVQERRADQHVARMEGRWVHFVGTDGLAWSACRVRDHAPAVMVARPTDPPEIMRGVLMHALGRLTNAVSGETVPLRRP
jgi:hypothetical protein